METSQTRRLFESIVKMKKSVAIYQKDKLMLDPTAFPLQIIAKFSEQNDDQLGVKMSIIGHVLGISKPGTTSLIDNLEKKGYVNRSLNKDDRRVVYV
ncbi:MAG: MarR family transcriptional regulator, partial [Oscillospiraceae bacterium]